MMHILSIKACKHILVVTQKTIMDMTISILRLLNPNPLLDVKAPCVLDENAFGVAFAALMSSSDRNKSAY